jgi:hypothetical protein
MAGALLLPRRGRKVAVQIDLKTHGVMWEDFRDGMVGGIAPKEKAFPMGSTAPSALKTPAPRG